MDGRTYKYMKESALYPFGYGLGYVDLKWSDPVAANKTVKKDQNLEISINVENDGSMTVDEVFQVYMKINNEKERLPLASLVDFKRVTILKGAQKQVTFSIPHNVFSYYNREGEKVQHKGKASIIIADASPGERSEELGAKSFEMDVTVK